MMGWAMPIKRSPGVHQGFQIRSFPHVQRRSPTSTKRFSTYSSPTWEEASQRVAKRIAFLLEHLVKKPKNIIIYLDLVASSINGFAGSGARIADTNISPGLFMQTPIISSVLPVTWKEESWNSACGSCEQSSQGRCPIATSSSAYPKYCSVLFSTIEN